MKKFTNLFFVLTLALLMLSGCNEKKSEPAPAPAPEPEPAPAEYVSVSDVSLSKTLLAFTAEGQTAQLTATVSPSNATNPKVTWKSSNTSVATVSDDGLVTCMGFGNTTITATAEDKSATCSVYVDDGTVTDACGNKYKYVVIGSQMWMSENMRCNKYDTQSERAGVEIEVYSYLNPKQGEYDPYCMDASEKNNWGDVHADNLSTEQIKNLGYMYNWAATVALRNEDEALEQTAPFDGNRQGICPNGWHVPTYAEWNKLFAFVGPNAWEKLKTTSGWYNGDNGTDEYSFAVLPAGSAYGNSLNDVGSFADFWTSTPYKRDSREAYLTGVHYDDTEKSLAFSVRCVRN